MVLAATLLVYLPTLYYQFVCDDLNQIVGNSHIQSWAYFPKLWTEHVWAQSYGPVKGNYYRPIFMVWLLLNHTVFGLKSMGWHLTAVLLHLVVTGLVYQLARKLLRDRPAALLATLVFALHPIQIESVAWISGATEPLAAIFMLGSYLAYIRSTELGDNKGEPPPTRKLFAFKQWYWASVALYGVALFCKETAAIVPATLFAYVLIFRPEHSGWRVTLRRGASEVLPYLAPLALYLPMRALALKSLLHASAKASLGTTLLTCPLVIWTYLHKLIAPFNLALYYDVQRISQPEWNNFGLPVCAVVVIGAALALCGRKSKMAAFASLWIGIHLFIPVAGLRFLPPDLVHDRYLYVASIGFALLAALAWQQLPRASAWGGIPVRTALAVLISLVWITGVLTQERYWKDEPALYSRSIAVSPNAALPYVKFAGTLMGHQEYSAALPLLLHAEEIGTDHVPDLMLGIWHYRQAHYGQAQFYLQQSLLKNQSAEQYFYLGDTLTKMGKLDEGVKNLRRAVEMFPASLNYRLVYAFALEQNGQTREAADQYQSVLAIIEATKDPLNDGQILRQHVAKLQNRIGRTQ